MFFIGIGRMCGGSDDNGNVGGGCRDRGNNGCCDCSNNNDDADGGNNNDGDCDDADDGKIYNRGNSPSTLSLMSLSMLLFNKAIHVCLFDFIRDFKM